MEDTEQTNRTMRDSMDTCPKCGNLNLEHGVCVPCQIKAGSVPAESGPWDSFRYKAKNSGSVDAIVDAHAPEAVPPAYDGFPRLVQDILAYVSYHYGEDPRTQLMISTWKNELKRLS